MPKHFRLPERFLLPLAILLLCLILAPRPSPAGVAQAAPAAPAVRCQPAQPAGQTGQELSVDFYVEDVDNLYGLDLRAEFDPTRLAVVDSNPAAAGIQLQPLNTFLTPDFLLLNTADNSAGTVAYAATQLNPRAPVSGSGSVVRITLLPQQAGVTTLAFRYTQLATPQGTAIEHTAVDCAITITDDGPACPPATAVWVDTTYGPTLDNDGHTWGCDAFAAIQPGIDAVEPGGTVFVASGSYAGALTVAKSVILHGDNPLPLLDAGSATAVTATNGSVILRGFQIATTATAFELVNATLSAYANNVAAATVLARDAGSTADTRHNWWNSHTTRPPGLDTDGWQARLGAPVQRWASGSTTAVLPDSGGGLFALQGGSGTAVLVSHGRATAAAGAPFGNSFGGQADATCSDFVDAFVRAASGTWQLAIPIDAGADHPGCDAVRQARAVYSIPAGTDIAGACHPADNPACWSAVPVARVAVDGSRLRVTGLSVSELGGTPFVAGASAGPVEPPETRYLLQLPAVFTPSSSQIQRTHGDPIQ